MMVCAWSGKIHCFRDSLRPRCGTFTCASKACDIVVCHAYLNRSNRTDAPVHDDPRRPDCRICAQQVPYGTPRSCTSTNCLPRPGRASGTRRRNWTPPHPWVSLPTISQPLVRASSRSAEAISWDHQSWAQHRPLPSQRDARLL